MFATLVFAASAQADTVQVNTAADENNTGPDCSLREAIAAVTGGADFGGCDLVTAGGTDQITFTAALTGGTIALEEGELGVDVGDPLEIVGPGMGSLTVSASTGDRVFNNDAGSTLTISGMTIRDGAPNGVGGAIRGGCVYNGGTLTLTEVRVTNCEANVTDGATDVFGDGGGIGNDNVLTLNSSVVVGNQARGINTSGAAGSGQARGAGIYSETGPVTINDSTIADNDAVGSDAGSGTAVAYSGLALINGNATITQSTISGNTAEADEESGDAFAAGGIYTNAVGTIEQSTIAGNLADPEATAATVPAGGIYSQGLTTTIRSSTIAQNGPTTLSLDGANVFSDGPSAVSIANSIVADPRGGGDNCLAAVPITSGGFNDDFSPGGASCFATPLATDQTVDPLLDAGGLGLNGGPTETIALQPASPMIDAGSNVGNTNLTEDQRGLTRPVDFTGLANAAGGNGTDIGAFEVQLACAGQATPTTVCPSTGGGGTTNPPGPTGQRAKALKKCKKIKDKKKRNKCKKRAKKKPV
jgi:CSLREA domain-containing protein